MKKPFFSIVIPTLNEEKYLPHLLADLEQQTFTDFEVLVVDGNSEDATVELGQTFLKKLPLVLLSCEERGVSNQRNLGAEKAQADWLIFMDADNRLPSFFLQGVKYQLEKNPTELFTTWMDSKSYTTKEEQLIAQTYNLGLDIYKYLKNPTAVGALLGIRKSVFLEQLFNDQLKIFEDHDLVKRTFEQGHTFSIFHDPTYTYSFRRFTKEGTLKMIALFISINVASLTGISTNYFEKLYPMKGGSYYDALNKQQYRFFKYLPQLLKETPKEQLQLLKKRFTDLRFKL